MKSLKEFVTDIYEKLDYKRIYKKFHSSPAARAKRAELNRYNRAHGTYGNGDGKDASHKGGKIVGYESEHKNRSRSEASRKPGSKRKPFHNAESTDFQSIKTLKEFMEKRPLYVRRDVLNAPDIIAWAKSMGFDKCVSPDDMHVTIVYSKEPMDRDRIVPQHDQLRLDGGVDGGHRSVEPLGDDGAIVLKFESKDLSHRWQQFRNLGASWDYEQYTPHITITYHNQPKEIKPDTPFPVPYDGVIILGPEKFEDLNLDFKDGIVEEGKQPKDIMDDGREMGPVQDGTNKLVKRYRSMTPGEKK